MVSFSAGSGGGLSARVDGQVISSGDTVVKGKMVVFTATADTGKTVDGWSGVENGSLSANQLTFIIDNLSAAANVYVTFKNSSTGGGGGSGGGSAPQVVNPSGEGVASPSTGGQISLGDEASITVPPLALQGNAEVNVAINRVTSSPDKPSGFMVLGQVFEFTVGGHNSYRFNKPVTLEFAFDPEDVPQGTKPSVYYYDASTSKWIELGGKVSGNSILITTDHFTLFAVMCKTEAAAIPQPITPLLSDLGQHWAKATIELLVGQGIISGYPDGTFKPNQTITRAEFVALLVRALKLEPTGSGKIFGDTTDHWARDTIAIAGSYGIVSGYDENTFGPNNPITREQMAVMAVKAIKLTSVSSVSEEIKFIDNRQISSWAKSSVSAAVKKRIMVGYPDNSFKPQGTATRAEAASVIHNLIR